MNARDAEIESGADLFDERVHAELIVTRHRGDFLADAPAGPDEQGEDQVGWRQRCLAHELADKRMVTQTARASGGEGRVGH